MKRLRFTKNLRIAPAAGCTLSGCSFSNSLRRLSEPLLPLNDELWKAIWAVEFDEEVDFREVDAEEVDGPM